MFCVTAVGSTNDVGAGPDNGWGVSYVCRAARGRATPCKSTCPGESASATAREGDCSSRSDGTSTVSVRDCCGAACRVVNEDCSWAACYCCGGWVSGLHGSFFIGWKVGAVCPT